MARKGRATKVTNSTRGRGKGASTATASDGNATNNTVASTTTRGRGGRGRAAPTVDTNARRRTRQAVKAGQNTSPVEEAPNDPEALARGAKTATPTAKGSAKTKTATTSTTETVPAPTSPVQGGSEQNATQGQEDVPGTAEEQPKTPKTPRTPKTPTTPKAPKSPTTPKTPKTPHTPKTPKAQKAPGTPKTPKTPKTPTTPPTPKTPNTPKTPKTPKTPIETEEAQNIVDGAEGQPLSPATGVKRDLPDEDADQQDESKRLKLDDEQTTTAPTSAQIETLMEDPSTEAAIQVDNDFEDGQAADREPPEIHYQSASLPPASSLLTPPEFRRVPTPPSGSLPQPSASPEQDERESSVEAPAVTDLPGPVWPVASTGDTEVDLGLTLQSEQGTTNPETENNKTSSPDHDDVAQRRRDSQLRALRAEQVRQDVSTAIPDWIYASTMPGGHIVEPQGPILTREEAARMPGIPREIIEATIPRPNMEPSRQASDTTTTISEDDARDLDNDLDKDLFGEEEDVVEQSQVITTPPPPPPVQFATSRNATSPPPTPGKIISPTGLHLPATPGPTKTTFFGNGNGSGSPPFTPQKGQYSDEGLSGTQQARDLGTSAHGEGEMPSSVGATGEPRGVESLVAAVSRAIDGDGKVNEDEERVASHEEGEHGNDERSSKLDVMSGQRIGEGGEDVDLTNEELDELYE